ncbi:putative ATP-dependent RNA helicase DHX35 [Neolecta irregularis DAH-3]|uniref:RNA helicase n=1 Tax=Neolecta irregularis (strain DAH-3) TaxID=1198029 RepID=A0A1U7LVU6_NEOID|nr:putative ATP-dependent RNA helicase DHX35 [Neolecta irregularis DAH-3]|eukprot:OLL26800.1 putative ATP-dependent RNA helicase DHX35 [Neolecta irregularis DAH-3]
MTSQNKTDHAESSEAQLPFYNKLAALSIQRQRQLLPIYRHRNALLFMVQKYAVTVVVGHTGCGKTTRREYQSMKLSNDKKFHSISMKLAGHGNRLSPPRRVAATTVSARVAEEAGYRLGEEVGYSIRFEDVTSDKTEIKFMTDGMLLREALIDPLLSRYSVIMLDEAHERTLYTDILLGVLKKIMKKRPELKIIVSSATLDAEAFQKFFNTNTMDDKEKDTAGIISLEGRTYPVEIMYLEEATENYVQKTIETVMKEEDGDILVFLTGREEINRCIEEIQDRASKLSTGKDLLALPLYAGLPQDEQMAIFEAAPEDTRKVVVSTNIAEASVTIDGIVHVIDCGFVKLRAYNPKTGMEILTVAPISKASASQRAGRAGRTRAGKCFRLYTEASYLELADSSVPEIQRSDLAPVILQLKALGIDNVLRFDFITLPPAEMIVRALELLFSLGALDDYAKLTKPLGLQMAEFPVRPMMAKSLLSSTQFGCGEQMLTIAAMTSVENIFVQSDDQRKHAESLKRKFTVEEGDHLTLYNVYQSFITKGKKDAKWCKDNYLNYRALLKAASVRSQLSRYMDRFNITIRSADPSTGSTAAQKCLTSAYFAHAAHQQPDGTYRLVKEGTVLWVHPTSVMFNRRAKWVIFHEGTNDNYISKLTSQVIETANKIYMKDITVIEKDWLPLLAPHYYEIKMKAGYNDGN